MSKLINHYISFMQQYADRSLCSVKIISGFNTFISVGADCADQLPIPRTDLRHLRVRKKAIAKLHNTPAIGRWINLRHLREPTPAEYNKHACKLSNDQA
jgi:hypothetical protein